MGQAGDVANNLLEAPWKQDCDCPGDEWDISSGISPGIVLEMYPRTIVETIWGTYRKHERASDWKQARGQVRISPSGICPGICAWIFLSTDPRVSGDGFGMGSETTSGTAIYFVVLQMLVPTHVRHMCVNVWGSRVGMVVRTAKAAGGDLGQRRLNSTSY